MKHGYGKMYWKTGAFYEGNWVDDMMHGAGKLVTANSEIFEGQFY